MKFKCIMNSLPQAQHSKESRKLSWASHSSRTYLTVRNLRFWACYHSPAGDSLASSPYGKHRFCGGIQYLKRVPSRTSQPAFRWAVYFGQWSRKVRRCYSAPWSWITLSRSQWSKKNRSESYAEYGMPLTSYSWITLGCLTFLRILISRVILSTSFWSWIFSFSRILTAT